MSGHVKDETESLCCEMVCCVGGIQCFFPADKYPVCRRLGSSGRAIQILSGKEELPRRTVLSFFPSCVNILSDTSSREYGIPPYPFPNSFSLTASPFPDVIDQTITRKSTSASVVHDLFQTFSPKEETPLSRFPGRWMYHPDNPPPSVTLNRAPAVSLGPAPCLRSCFSRCSIGTRRFSQGAHRFRALVVSNGHRGERWGGAGT